MTTVKRMLLTEEQRWEYISIAKMELLIPLQPTIFLIQSVCGRVEKCCVSSKGWQEMCKCRPTEGRQNHAMLAQLVLCPGW